MELKPYKTGLIVDINKARSTTKIIDCSDIKLKQLFAICGAYVSISQVPNEVETKVLIDFTKEYLPRYGAEEIVLAFKELANNTYQVETGHFGKLSPSYLKDVIDAYKAWRDKIITQSRKEIEPPKPKNMTQEESYKYIDSFCERKNEIPIGAPWSDAYNFMARNGIVKPTNEEKAKIKKLVGNKTSPLSEDFIRDCKKEYVLQFFELKYGLERSKFTI